MMWKTVLVLVVWCLPLLCWSADPAASEDFCGLCRGKQCPEPAPTQQSCQSQNGVFVPSNTSAWACLCCPLCVNETDYCDQCRVGERRCRDADYAWCKDSFQPPSYSKAEGCRCCSGCCCEHCAFPRCRNVSRTECERLGGTFMPIRTQCGQPCRCCSGCTIPVGPGEDCGPDDGYERVCPSDLRCCDGECRPASLCTLYHLDEENDDRYDDD